MSDKNADKEGKKIDLKSKIEKSQSKTKNKPSIEADRPKLKSNLELKKEIKKTKFKSEKKGRKIKTEARDQDKQLKSEKKPKKTKITKQKPKIKPKPKEKVVTETKKVPLKLERVKIYGILVNYRLGHSSQHNLEFLIKIPNVNDNLKASKFIGHRAIWQTKKGKKIVGNILCIHGKNGILRARFRKGLPGQVRGKEVEII